MTKERIKAVLKEYFEQDTFQRYIQVKDRTTKELECEIYSMDDGEYSVSVVTISNKVVTVYFYEDELIETLMRFHNSTIEIYADSVEVN